MVPAHVHVGRLDAIGGKSPGPGWLTPVATKRPIFTVTGGCAADSPAISAIVTVRVHMSNDTGPWLAFAPLSRTAAKAASTSLAICRWT
jgi:hypothetical protein